MTTKIIHFTVGGKKEQAEFWSDDSSSDVKDLFRAAAEANPSDILKLYNVKGNIININERLPENTPEQPYRLEVVASSFKEYSSTVLKGFDLEKFEQRLARIEQQTQVLNGCVPEEVQEMKAEVESFRVKLEGYDHLSWLGLHKDLATKHAKSPFWSNEGFSKRPSDAHKRLVQSQFEKLCSVQVSEEVRDYLRKPTFDNWQWDDAEMLILLRQMYIDLDLVHDCNIEMDVLNRWLFDIYSNYNIVPFHNFKHCFMVAQMMYGLIWLIGLQEKMESLELLVLVTSAICHDLDHPGYNNAYQINARTPLAVRYNDISPLENHHCSSAFVILENNQSNILRNLTADDYRRVREGMIRCILATDMAKHNDILSHFKTIPEFDFGNKEHRQVMDMILMKVADISNEARPMEVAEPWIDRLLEEFFTQLTTTLLKVSDISTSARSIECGDMWVDCLLEEFFLQLDMILVKAADISNEVRPVEVAEPWVDCLLLEFYTQSDVEKLEGLPVAPFMDREKVTKPSSQIGFIKFVLLPLFEALAETFPVITKDILEPVKRALQYYTDMHNALEEKKRNDEAKSDKDKGKGDKSATGKS